MGGARDGVDSRAKSIRIRFSFEGRQHKLPLKLNGELLAPTPANNKHAARVASEIKSKIKLGIFRIADYFPDATADAPSLTTLDKQLDSWLASQRIEQSTRKGYESAIKFWKTAPSDEAGTKLGDRPVRNLLTSHVLTALASRPSISGKTVNNYVSVLREALDLAVTDRLIAENVAAKVKRAKHQKQPPDPFTADERDRIIADLMAKHPGQAANFARAWFWTGLRTSEIFGLNWESVDLASGYIVIKEAIVRGLRKANTKTNLARRVALNSEALAAFKAQKAHTLIQGREVFQDPRYSAPWGDERAFRRSYWEPALKRLGIRYRRPYQMRHTYATAMLMAGMTPAFCAKQLGHSVEIFHSTYARWIDGERDDLEMARLEQLISPAKAQREQAAS